MSYLAGLQKVLYEFDDRTTVFNNLATFSDIMGTNINDVTSYELYDIIDGARPDQVSLELYNTPLYHWTLFLLNVKSRGSLKTELIPDATLPPAIPADTILLMSKLANSGTGMYIAKRLGISTP